MRLVPVIMILLLLICAATTSYCEESKAINKSPFAFLQGFFMGDSYVEYQSQLQKIEDRYKKGEITKEEYIELKTDASKEYKESI